MINRRTTFAQGVFAAIVCAVVTFFLFAGEARGQVTDKPIATWPTVWTGVVQHLSINDKTGCVAGWAPAPDKWSERRLQMALADGVRLTGAGQLAVSEALTAKSAAGLAAARTINLRTAGADGVMGIDPVAAPCYGKLQEPAHPWVVSPASTGKRPAYLLKADGTRGAQAGSVDTTVTGNGKTVPNVCECGRLRSKETSSSTYCPPAWFAPESTQAKPIPARVVTLCRAG